MKNFKWLLVTIRKWFHYKHVVVRNENGSVFKISINDIGIIEPMPYGVQITLKTQHGTGNDVIHATETYDNIRHQLRYYS